MNREAVARELVAVARELTGGAGISDKALYGRIRRGLLRMIRDFERNFPDVDMRYHNREISGTVAGHEVRVFYAIYRASNAEVAGLPVLIVDGKTYEKFYRDVTEQLKKVICDSLVASSRREAVRMVHKRDFYRPNPMIHQNIKQIDVAPDVDIEVWQYENNGKLFGVAFQGRAQKPLWHYRFRNEAQLKQEVLNTVERRRQHIQHKKERQEERRQFRHDLKVGTILYTSWGYDQTNIDFYQVVEAGEKSVVIREVAQKTVRQSRGADYVVAVPNKFTGPKMKKRVRPGNSVKIESYANARVWDGKPKYQTAAGWGH